MNRSLRRLLIGGVLGLFVVVTALAVPLAGMAQTSGNVAVSGTNNATITVALSDVAVNFGTNIGPSGAASNGTNIAAHVDGAVPSTGAFYVFTGTANAGVRITVNSNKVWQGTAAASESAGTATSMRVASGTLRFTAANPADFAAATAGTAYTVAPLTWQAAGAKGNVVTNHYPSLRVLWSDDPGTFASTITYQVSQP